MGVKELVAGWIEGANPGVADDVKKANTKEEIIIALERVQ